jgi:hypothetical protein
MEGLASIIADGLGDHNLTVIPANDARAARQLDQNGGHGRIVAPQARQRRFAFAWA